MEQQNDYTPVTTSPNADGAGKYDVEMWTYPSDLFGTGAAKYGKSWVMININVQKNTAKSEAFGQGVDINKSEQRRFNEATARNNTVAGAVASGAASGAAVGAASSFSLDKLLNPATRKAAGVEIATAGVKGALTGAAATLPIAIAGTATRETKRIRHAIQLPMPNNLITGYSAQWGEADTNIFDLAMRAPSMAAGAVSKAMLGDVAAAQALAVQGALGGGGASVASGLAANPKKEVVFDNMGFRTFTLEYKFYPRDEQEASKIYYILYQLKYHMHPEYFSEGRFTYVYPSEFDITFYNSDGNELTWVNKIATSVLTDLRVNYTPEGTWAAHEGGNPNAIQVQMTFKELSILTKENIDQGF
jgi:hypothetical protein